MRELRIKYAAKANGWESQKRKNDQLEQENKSLRKKIKDLEQHHHEEVGKITGDMDRIRLERDQLKELLFKKNSKKKEALSDEKVHFIEKRHKKKAWWAAWAQGKRLSKTKPY